MGTLAVGYPEVLRKIAEHGHTIGSHTYWHGRGQPRGKMGPLSRLKPEQAIEEIERGISAVRLAIGKRAASFFRYPELKDTPATLEHLAKRNIAVFSTDVDSFDFKSGSPKTLVRRVMAKLKKRGKGIILFHDTKRATGEAMPDLLAQLKVGGYKIVHMVSKAPLTSLPKYDKIVTAGFKGAANMAGARPMSSVVSTVQDNAN